MADDDNRRADEAKAAGGTSRRTALKAGVGVGVGAFAWSGGSITSLGGTPAYAAGCTFVVNLDLSGGCRNTNQPPQVAYGFGYHPLNPPNLPGYSLNQTSVLNNTPCDAGASATLTSPAGITCRVTLKFRGPNQCTNNPDRGTYVFNENPVTNQTVIPLNCYGYDNKGDAPSNMQYTIVAKCNTTGAPIDCIT